MTRIRWAILACVSLTACIVSTETVPGSPGDKGEPGEPGAPGQPADVWVRTDGYVYYDGRVGIGSFKSTAPAAQLEVNTGGALIKGEAASLNATTLTLRNENIGHGGSIFGIEQLLSKADFDPPGNMLFMRAQTTDTEMGAVDRFYVTGNGGAYFADNVGIGTATYNERLAVNGGIISYSESQDLGVFYTMNASAEYRDAYVIGKDIRFSTSNSGQDTQSSPRLFIAHGTGYVGIGTESPAYLLHVNGTAAKPDGPSWTTPSDRRLKQNIGPLPAALERLLRLRGVTFEWKDPAKHGNLHGVQIGMIAQEVEDVFPGWVGSGADGYKTLTFRGFEALAVEGFRTLRTENDALRRDNEKLGKEVEDLRHAIEAERTARRKLEDRTSEIERRLTAAVRK